MKPKSKTAFQYYEDFQGWEENQQSNYNSLLQKLNQNLSSYEQKYRKHMLLLKPSKLTQKHLQKVNLPNIQNGMDHNFVLKKKQSNKKIFFNQNSFSFYLHQNKQTTNSSQIFQNRNKYLKLKAIGLQTRISKQKLLQKEICDNSLQQMNILKYSVKVPKRKYQSFRIKEKENYIRKKQGMNEFSDKELFAKANKQFF